MNKVCIYRGPARSGSEYHGEVAAYLTASHDNTKTGGVVGLVVAPAGVGFWQAVKSGLDARVCGTCSHRSKPAGGDGSCYVRNGSQVGMGLKWLDRADTLPVLDDGDLAPWLRLARRRGARALRSAIWGDAGALPVEVWTALESACTDAKLDVLGYTHAHLDGVPHLRRTHVASIDGEACTPDGWRSFRVAEPGAKPRASEFACPASAERGHRVTCGDCMACGSVGNAQSRRSVVIWRHDAGGQARTRRLLSQLRIAV